MIERFNFYDVYGYFLPGAALFALVWLPFGIVERFWPATAFSSAIAVLAFAYIIGHVIQTVATNALPSQEKDPHRRRRFPSDILLDPENASFPSEFKHILEEQVASDFHLALNVNQCADEAISNRRQTAFFLCRAALIRAKVAFYPEQFEGMYSLMRGLAVAFWLGGLFLTGWAVAALRNDCFREVFRRTAIGGLALVVLLSSFSALKGPRYKGRFAVDAAILISLLVTLFSLGTAFGLSYSTFCYSHLVFVILALAAIFAGIRCYGAYKYFTMEFAKAIWRDYSGYRTSHPRDA